MNHPYSQRHGVEFLALLALFVGAMTTGSAGILVRMSETGPTATAFWRGALALPWLGVWALLERGKPASAAGSSGIATLWQERAFLWGGLFFACDLTLWNWSLLLTSIAASTLEACLAPLVVTLIVWLRWGERPSRGFVVALGVALVGMVMIVSPKFGHGHSAFTGDLFGLATACFYAMYILAVAKLRTRYGTGLVMFNTTLVFTVLLIPLALTQKFFPDTPRGWLIVAGGALASQVIGQSLIAYALAHLPATFTSLGLLIQSFGAAIAAWLVLGEQLAAIQIAGGCVVLSAIALARSARKPSLSAVSEVGGGSAGVLRD